jgi:hypothetical protein
MREMPIAEVLRAATLGEAERCQAEDLRNSAEVTRQDAETQRQLLDSIRQEREQLREQREEMRMLGETSRVAAESTRQALLDEVRSTAATLEAASLHMKAAEEMRQELYRMIGKTKDDTQ